MIDQQIALSLLNSELSARKERNSSYSLRSFARDLKTSPGTLSGVLNGKRPLTLEKAKEWVSLLKLTKDKEDLFLSAVEKGSEKRLNPTERAIKKLRERFDYRRLKLDQFAVIKEWYHLGLLNLIKLSRFKNDPVWISRELRISQKEAKGALDRLTRLGLIKEENDKLIRTDKSIETPTDIKSSDIRQFHSQVINNSLASLENDDIDLRDITSIMFTLDKEKLPEAKKKIQIFRREMAEFLTSENADDVYSLNIQLFPQSKGGKK